MLYSNFKRPFTSKQLFIYITIRSIFRRWNYRGSGGAYFRTYTAEIWRFYLRRCSSGDVDILGSVSLSPSAIISLGLHLLQVGVCALPPSPLPPPLPHPLHLTLSSSSLLQFGCGEEISHGNVEHLSIRSILCMYIYIYIYI